MHESVLLYTFEERWEYRCAWYHIVCHIRFVLSRSVCIPKKFLCAIVVCRTYQVRVSRRGPRSGSRCRFSRDVLYPNKFLGAIVHTSTYYEQRPPKWRYSYINIVTIASINSWFSLLLLFFPRQRNVRRFARAEGGADVRDGLDWDRRRCLHFGERPAQPTGNPASPDNEELK